MPHLYTICVLDGENKLVEIGNGGFFAYRGAAFLRTAEHVASQLSRFGMDVGAHFHVPSGNPQPDEAIARIGPIPTRAGVDQEILNFPDDLDMLSLGGQVNVLMGYKDDGLFVRWAGIVVPTPPPMLARVYTYFNVRAPGSEVEIKINARLGQGGLMLVPKFFGEPVSSTEVRASGRSGSMRFVYSPKERCFVAAAGFVAVTQEISVAGGRFALGYVESVANFKRGLEEASAKSLPPIKLQPVPAMRGMLQIAPRVFLRRRGATV